MTAMKSVATAVILCLICGPVWAKQITAACLKSDRGQRAPGLCACIQDAADLTLTSRDQRLAASFFANPDRAQEVRQSNRRRDEEFWERYENFGQMAETFCAR